MKNNINNFTAAMQYTHLDMMNSCSQTCIPARPLSSDSSEMAVGGGDTRADSYSNGSISSVQYSKNTVRYRHASEGKEAQCSLEFGPLSRGKILQRSTCVRKAVQSKPRVTHVIAIKAGSDTTPHKPDFFFLFSTSSEFIYLFF